MALSTLTLICQEERILLHSRNLMTHPPQKKWNFLIFSLHNVFFGTMQWWWKFGFFCWHRWGGGYIFKNTCWCLYIGPISNMQLFTLALFTWKSILRFLFNCGKSYFVTYFPEEIAHHTMRLKTLIKSLTHLAKFDEHNEFPSHEPRFHCATTFWHQANSHITDAH